MTDTEIALLTGICTHANIDEAMQRTHNSLIAQAGPRRLTGVEWRTACGPDGLAKLVELAADGGPAWVAYLDQCRSFWAQHGDDAVLVVASCEVAK